MLCGRRRGEKKIEKRTGFQIFIYFFGLRRSVIHTHQQNFSVRFVPVTIFGNRAAVIESLDTLEECQREIRGYGRGNAKPSFSVLFGFIFFFFFAALY